MPDQCFESRIDTAAAIYLDQPDLSLTASTCISAEAQDVHRNVVFLLCDCRERTGSIATCRPPSDPSLGDRGNCSICVVCAAVAMAEW